MRRSHTHPRVNWLRQCGSEGATSSAGRINYHHTAARNLSRELEGGTAPLQGSTDGNGQSGVGQGCAGKPGGGYWPAAPPRHRTIALARKKTVGPENHRPRNVGRPGGGRPTPSMDGGPTPQPPPVWGVGDSHSPGGGFPLWIVGYMTDGSLAAGDGTLWRAGGDPSWERFLVLASYAHVHLLLVCWRD